MTWTDYIASRKVTGSGLSSIEDCVYLSIKISKITLKKGKGREINRIDKITPNTKTTKTKKQKCEGNIFFHSLTEKLEVETRN